MRKRFLLTALGFPLLLWSCGNSEKSKQTDTAAIAPTETTETNNGTSETSNAIVITANDQMRFDLDEIRVEAGKEISLTLKNTGELSKESMGHNWVLLKPGSDVTAFAMEAMSSKQTDFIPAKSDAVVVHTRLLGPGESDKITFSVEKGEYEYICSFPGHYGIMRGKLIAE